MSKFKVKYKTILLILPTHAKVIKGNWKDYNGYGGVWCKVDHFGQHSDLSLIHPKYGGFAWVDQSDCIFAIKIKYISECWNKL